ncbi:DUF736 domain-containing protein [Sphingobium sp. WTD-1]|uniref:DUF736 domain-containing protein n=1 Tax=Pseudomonadota TaxID=1224 RepID=UPI001E3DAF23|nr:MULTISPECIES: DUF736 domain-containing protein [Pseudomonadota]MCE4545076.1 DUF736 domain-containing protein [Caballeronia sp. PC1]WIA57734.1 DUF736 domain-containing protein [Sphingobium sp. WTD-1]
MSTWRRNGAGQLFSAAFGFAARSKKAALRPSLGRKPTPPRKRDGNPEQRCAADCPRSSTCHEAAKGAVPSQERTDDMICGNFTATDRGFHGEIRFFGLSEKVEILRIDDKASDKSPDYRIVAADDERIEFGVGWLKATKDQKPYASLKLNPVLAPDVHLRLVSTETTGKFELKVD